MTDDIVTRLREFVRMGIPVGVFHATKAADEIERLRADRYRWQAIAFCRTCEPADGYYCTKHRQDEEGKA